MTLEQLHQIINERIEFYQQCETTLPSGTEIKFRSEIRALEDLRMEVDFKTMPLETWRAKYKLN